MTNTTTEIPTKKARAKRKIGKTRAKKSVARERVQEHSVARERLQEKKSASWFGLAVTAFVGSVVLFNSSSAIQVGIQTMAALQWGLVIGGLLGFLGAIQRNAFLNGGRFTVGVLFGIVYSALFWALFGGGVGYVIGRLL